MNYILTITAKRRNAKRHIAQRGESLEELIRYSNVINKDRYHVDIYNGKWELVKKIR